MVETTLQCRHRVPCPAQTPQPLGPVEPEGVFGIPSEPGLAGVVREEHSSGIDVARRNEDHSLPALRDPREPRVDQPVGPAIPERLELGHQVAHGLATIEDEHVPDVLEEEDGRPVPLQ